MEDQKVTTINSNSPRSKGANNKIAITILISFLVAVLLQFFLFSGEQFTSHYSNYTAGFSNESNPTVDLGYAVYRPSYLDVKLHQDTSTLKHRTITDL